MGPCIVPTTITITSPGVVVKLPVDTVVPEGSFSLHEGATAKAMPLLEPDAGVSSIAAPFQFVLDEPNDAVNVVMMTLP